MKGYDLFPVTCTSWSWSLLPFEDVVRIMSIIGFKAIDIGAFTGWANFDAADLAARDNRIATDLKRIKDEHGMTRT